MPNEYPIFREDRLNDYGSSHASNAPWPTDLKKEFTGLEPLQGGKKGGICAAMTAMFAKKCFELMAGQIRGRHLTLPEINSTAQMRAFLNLEIAQASMEMRVFRSSAEQADYALGIQGLRTLPNPTSGPDLSDLSAISQKLAPTARAVYYLTIGDGAHAMGIMVRGDAYLLDPNHDLYYYPTITDLKYCLTKRIKDPYPKFLRDKWEMFEVTIET